MEKDKKRKLEETIKLANTSDKKIAKMNYKERQLVYKAKSILCKMVWNSSINKTYKKSNKKEK